MGFSLFNGRFGAAAAIVAAMGFGLATAHAGGQGEKIEFSDPGIPLETSNLSANLTPGMNRLNPAPNAFKQVQEDLFRPLTESIKNVNSMQGVTEFPTPPKPQTAFAPSKRLREQLDRQRNWAFTDLSYLNSTSSAEEIMGVKEYDDVGQEKKPVSVFEKYLNPLKQLGVTNRSQMAEIYEAAGIIITNGYAMAIPSLPVQVDFSKIKKTFASDNEASGNNTEPSADSALSTINKEEVKAQRLHEEEFRRLLDPSLPPLKAANNPYLTGNFQEPSHAAPSLFGDDQTRNAAAQPAAAVRHNLTSVLPGIPDPTDAATHSRVFDNPTDTAFGQPAPQPVKVVTPPVTAESVQAELNPFSTVIKKRLF